MILDAVFAIRDQKSPYQLLVAVPCNYGTEKSQYPVIIATIICNYKINKP